MIGKRTKKTISVKMKKTCYLFEKKKFNKYDLNQKEILTNIFLNRYFLYLADIENYLSFDANKDFRSISK
jgi:hypothetical protein